MKERPLTVEFRLPATKTIPKPPPGAKAERQRQERAARKARNLALAYYIEELIRAGEVADLAAVARMCGVSRARVSRIFGLLGIAEKEKAWALRAPPRAAPLDSRSHRPLATAHSYPALPRHAV